MNTQSALTLVAIALLASPSNAASILWLQNNDGIDAGWKTLLEDDGHTLTAFTANRGLPNQADRDYVNSFDLVVIARSAFNASPTSGGPELNSAGTVWNTQITTPIIMMQAYLPAGHFGSNWGWTTTTGSGHPTTVDATQPMTVGDASSPIWTGVTVSNGNPTPSALHTGNTMTIDPPLRPGAVVLASSPVNGNPLIALLPTGTTVGGGDLSGERLFFSMASGNDAMNLTTLGEQVFLNSVDFMAIPEPSTVLSVGIAALVLLRRRRG